MSGADTAQLSGMTSITNGEGGAATVQVDPEAAQASREKAAEDAAASGLIGGKFKSQEDLLASYQALEKRLSEQGSGQQEADTEKAAGESDASAEGEGEETAEKTGDEGPDYSDLKGTYGEAVGSALEASGIDVAAAAAHFDEHGKLSDSDYKSLVDSGIPGAMIDSYLSGVSKQNAAAAEAEAAVEMTENQITAIKATVGGDEGFESVRNFVRSNYTAEQKAEFNAAVETAEFDKVFSAVQAANAAMIAANGVDPVPLGGTATGGVNGFADHGEMKKAMADPRYKTSAEYRAQVEQRLAASTNLFKRR